MAAFIGIHYFKCALMLILRFPLARVNASCERGTRARIKTFWFGAKALFKNVDPSKIHPIRALQITEIEQSLPPAVPGLIPHSRSIQTERDHSLPAGSAYAAPVRSAGGLYMYNEHARRGYDMPCHVMRARSALSTSHVQGGQVHVVRAGRSRLDGNAWLMPGYEMPPLSAVGKTGLKPGWMRRLMPSGCRCRADVLTNSPACDDRRAENQRTLSEPELVWIG